MGHTEKPPFLLTRSALNFVKTAAVEQLGTDRHVNPVGIKSSSQLSPSHLPRQSLFGGPWITKLWAHPCLPIVRDSAVYVLSSRSCGMGYLFLGVPIVTSTPVACLEGFERKCVLVTKAEGGLGEWAAPAESRAFIPSQLLGTDWTQSRELVQLCPRGCHTLSGPCAAHLSSDAVEMGLSCPVPSDAGQKARNVLQPPDSLCAPGGELTVSPS